MKLTIKHSEILKLLNISLPVELEIIDDLQDTPSAKVEELWFPDDSGEWVDISHVDPMDREDRFGQMSHSYDMYETFWFEALSESERENKDYIPTKHASWDIRWESVVAFKKVKNSDVDPD